MNEKLSELEEYVRKMRTQSKKNERVQEFCTNILAWIFIIKACKPEERV